MNHCVPDWDGNVGELDAFLASSPDVYLSPVKSKWETSPHRRRDCDTVEHDWTDNGLIAMQENESKGSNSQWQNYGNNLSGVDHDSEDAVTPSKPRSNSTPGKDGDNGGAQVGDGSAGDTTVPAAVAAPPPPLPPIPRPSDDDEMTSWIGSHAWLYPMEASLEKTYCSDLFGDLPNSDISGIHLGREPFVEGPSAAAVRSIRNSVTPFSTLSSVNNMSGGGGSSSLHRASSADAAMALGAGRAAGLLPQAGVEAFTKVRTTMQQPHAGGKGPSLRSNPNSPAASNAMLPPKSQPSSLQPVGSGNVNFPQFSALGWRNMQSVGGVPTHSGNGMNRVKSPMKAPSNRVVAAAPTSAPESSIATSTMTKLQSEGSRKASFPQVGMERSSGGQQSLGTESSSWASMQNSKEGEAVVNSAVEIADAVNSEPGPVDQDKCHPTTGSASVKHASQGKEIAEAPEPTVTTCSGGSGGSGNCTEHGLEVGSCSKRKAREAEESECQSEDGEEELAEMKKPVRRGGTTKRSRAAEVHNLSERRRRDRINERMKLLQELIPNSNKTDKASMLEEAIDYVKLLHAQLQGVTHELHQRNSYQQMCVPNGMNGMGVGPMVMPSAMQHLQMPLQMGSMPPIGMGMRPMVGMGMMDMGAMAPMRPSHLMPTPSPGSHGGPAPCVSATSPAVSMVDSTDHRLQNNTVMESLNVYLARQQQLQLPSQPMNMNLYNNYAMHQRQQQQQQLQHQQQQLLHHQQQQQQHQQQQHQLHLPHMGGGALQ